MNQRCIRTTTATGGSMAITEVAMMMFHSFCASPLPIILVRPTMMVSSERSLMISSGHKYWFQP